MITRAVRTAALCAAMLCPPCAFAMVEVQAVQHKSAGLILAARVSEDIAPGDYEALLQGLIGHPGQYAQKVVLLDSIGGSLSEAIRMGRLLRETGFDAVVPVSAVCQGTCVYLLAAGRNKTVRGHVGIHRPYFAHGDSARAAAVAGRQDVSPAAYLREMNIPGNLAQDMQAIAPAHMRVLSVQELARYRLD